MIKYMVRVDAVSSESQYKIQSMIMVLYLLGQLYLGRAASRLLGLCHHKYSYDRS
jgi:CRISPR/Cas system CSM-associated protein Csm3 (group 7 of RAMP superfamily)